MKERPILFSAPMVRAILAGRKTQTRRVIRADWLRCQDPEEDREAILARCPFGAPGDRLWVRETFWISTGNGIRGIYRADGPPLSADGKCEIVPWRWRPSIHMERRWSRIDLEVTELRVERLQEITEADAMAEGVEPTRYPGLARDVDTARENFTALWDGLNKARGYGWDSNCWVWAVSFRVLRPLASAPTPEANAGGSK